MKKIITLAILVGIFGNILFLLGIIGLFYPVLILIITFFYWGGAIYFLRKKMPFSLPSTQLVLFEKVLIGILVIEGLINLIGVLGPEIGFDALWYHLTLPKLYLFYHTIRHFPGGLLYYSDMPKLTELLYSVPLSIHSETGAKFIHVLFGIGICVTLYYFARKYVSKTLALLAVILFYSNLVVGWESVTAYIDLARTFFEFLAFVLLIQWSDHEKKNNLYLSAIMLGLAVSTKLLTLASVPLYLIVIGVILIHKRKNLLYHWKEFFSYTGIVLFIPLPWFILSFLSTGKPFFPFFTDVSQGSINPLSITQFIHDVFVLFVNASDPLSPLYMIFLPVIVIAVRKKEMVLRITSLYSLLAIIIWYFLPRIGGGRFILPYLPVFSFLSVYAVHLVSKTKESRNLEKISIGLIIFYSFVFMIYRGVANAKFVPYLIGRESKAQFLSKHLNFSYGDFYDTDGYLGKTIRGKDTVLLYGVHNLYYVNFPFIDSSYVKKGDRFNYILTQHTQLPSRFDNWNLLYTNSVTGVQLYGNGGMMWEY